MATFTVVVPVKGMRTTKNHKDEVVGIPFLGECQRFILKEEELIPWVESMIADTTTGSMFYIERHGR